MNEEHIRSWSIRKILVALDASISSLNALHTAVDLAARFDAEVVGLFVEDINLLRLAELPIAREISLYAPTPRSLRLPEMEAQLRIQAAQIRRKLAQIADAAGVAWEFRTTRGSVAAEVIAAGADADLVILGKIGRSLPGMYRSGSTVRTLLMQRRGMTMIMQTRIKSFQMPVVAVYDGAPTSPKTLDTAAGLAQIHETALIVFVIGEDPAAVENYHLHAARLLEDVGMREVVFRMRVKPNLQSLAADIARESGGPVVIPCMEDMFAGDQLCGLVEEIVNPVLLVR